MPEARRQAEPQNSRALLDRRLAYLLLRLTLGIQMIYAIIYYLLLTGRTYDYFALDTVCTKCLGRSKSAFT